MLTPPAHVPPSISPLYNSPSTRASVSAAHTYAYCLISTSVSRTYCPHNRSFRPPDTLFLPRALSLLSSPSLLLVCLWTVRYAPAADTHCACPRPAAVALLFTYLPARYYCLLCRRCPRSPILSAMSVPPPCGAEIRVVYSLMCTMKSNQNIPLLASFTPQV